MEIFKLKKLFNLTALEKIFFGFVFVTLFGGIGRWPFLDPDSYLWLEKSFEIYWNNNWLSFHPFLGKPPLYMWLNALFLKIFGVHTWVFMLPTQIFSFLLVVSIYILAKELFSRKEALLASFIFFASANFLFLRFAFKEDILCAFFVTLGFWFLTKFLKKQSPKYLFGIYVASFLALFVRSTFGMMPLIVLFIYFVKEANIRKAILNQIFIQFLAVLFSISLILPWLVVQYQIYGSGFTYLLMKEHVLRLFMTHGSSGHRDNEWFNYFLTVQAIYMPFAVALIPAFISSFKNKKLQSLVLWFVIPFIIFSASGELKVIRYLMFAYVPLSIILANYFLNAQVSRRERNFITGIAVIAVIFVLGLISAGLNSPDSFTQLLNPLLIPFLVLNIIATVLLTVYFYDQKEFLKHGVTFTALSVIALVTLSFVHLETAYPEAQFQRTLGKALKTSLVYGYQTGVRQMCHLEKNFIIVDNLNKIPYDAEIISGVKIPNRKFTLVAHETSVNKGGRESFEYWVYSTSTH
jgi:4-amino-4-deoxy-L-arabinose transferase-like glycosyltransferase